MLLQFGNKSKRFMRILTEQQPSAEAVVQGDKNHASIKGTVSFFSVNDGALVAAEISGLPAGAGLCRDPVLGFHIHEGNACTGNADDPFADAKSHYNPEGCPHPEHAGDMPPLFSNGGFAWSVFFTGRFRVDDVIGRTVIIHDSPDDFTTQPSGNSGKKIACGVIRRNFKL